MVGDRSWEISRRIFRVTKPPQNPARGYRAELERMAREAISQIGDNLSKPPGRDLTLLETLRPDTTITDTELFCIEDMDSSQYQPHSGDLRLVLW